MTSAIAAVAEGLRRAGVDLPLIGLAWARALPVATLVPAFGLRALPAPLRPAMALAIAVGIVPAVAPVATASPGPWVVAALVEVARGLPVAVAAAVPLWAATTAGGLADALRGASHVVEMPTVEERSTPLAVLLSLLACATFLSTGGPAAVAVALARAPEGVHSLEATAEVLVSGIGLAMAIGSPILAASVVIEVAAALVSRATSPTQVAAMVAPLRTMGILAAFALLLDRIGAAWLRALPR